MFFSSLFANSNNVILSSNSGIRNFPSSPRLVSTHYGLLSGLSIFFRDVLSYVSLIVSQAWFRRQVKDGFLSGFLTNITSTGIGQIECGPTAVTVAISPTRIKQNKIRVLVWCLQIMQTLRKILYWSFRFSRGTAPRIGSTPIEMSLPTKDWLQDCSDDLHSNSLNVVEKHAKATVIFHATTKVT